MSVWIKMLSASEVSGLIAIQDFVQLGKLAELASKELDHDIGLSLFRGEIAAGRLKSARTIIQSIEPTTNDQQLAIQHAYLAFLDTLAVYDLDQALNRIEKCEKLLPNNAELNWIAVRVKVFVSQAGKKITPDLEALYESLPAIAEQLMQSGYSAFSRDARLMYTDYTSTQEAWKSWISEAQSNGNSTQLADGYFGLAQLLKAENAPQDQIIELLDKALVLYKGQGHLIKPIDIARIKTELAVEWEGESPEHFSPIVQRYLDSAYPNGALSLLFTASSVAHNRGNRRLAIEFSDRLQHLSEKVGSGLVAQQSVFRLAELAMRSGEYALARNMCDQALAKQGTAGFNAGIHAMKASSYNFVHNQRAAINEYEKAIELYLACDMESAASDLIAVLANCYAHDRSVEAIRTGDKLLVDWIVKDEKRDDELAVATKTAERAFLLLLPASSGEATQQRQINVEELAKQARQLLQDAQAYLPDDEVGQRPDVYAVRAKIAQTRSQVATMLGDIQLSRAETEKALNYFNQAHLPYQAADCSYSLGCLDLFRLNTSLTPDARKLADQVESQLIAAYDFYRETSGMVMQSAQAAHKLAMLYLNMHPQFVLEAQKKLATLAENLLVEAQSDIDTLRRGFEAPTKLDSYEGKQVHSSLSAQLLTEALRLHLHAEPDHAKAWQWVTQSKARALNDLVATNTHLSVETKRLVDADNALSDLIEKERVLVQKLMNTPAANRLGLNAEIKKIRAELNVYPEMQAYLRSRTGQVDSDSDLSRALETAPATAFVDYLRVHNSIWVSVTRPGESPVFERLHLSGSAIDEFLTVDFAPRSRRSLLRDEPELLDVLEPLIKPLGWLTLRDEHLIFCVTGDLRSLPIHALKLDGEYLINRNPVSWVPSLALLRNATAQRPAVATSAAAVFGQPEVDETDATSYAKKVASLLQQEPQLGSAVTQESLKKALQTSQIVHFNGHSVFVANDPLSSHLRLANGASLSVRDVFDLQTVCARLVTLGACESSVSQQLPGDEPFGMAAGLLQAGVPTVIGSLWKVRDKATGLLMENFYKAAVEKPGMTPGVALQQAVLSLKKQPGYESPYFWASMILTGNPWTDLTMKKHP